MVEAERQVVLYEVFAADSDIPRVPVLELSS